MVGAEEEYIWWGGGDDELTIVEATSPPGFVKVVGPPFCGIAEPAAEIVVSIVLVVVAQAD